MSKASKTRAKCTMACKECAQSKSSKAGRETNSRETGEEGHGKRESGRETERRQGVA